MLTGGASSEVRHLKQHNERQDKRLDALHDKLYDRGELLQDLRHSLVEMSDELEGLRAAVGREKAKSKCV